jgi:hypothetical protein
MENEESTKSLKDNDLKESEEQSQSLIITEKEIAEATSTLKKYKEGKTNLERRIIENEQWWKMRHWDIIRGKTGNSHENDPRPVSAWLFNSIANKHADAMDNYPIANVLPREEGDQEDAQTLSDILPVIFEHNNFEQTYSDCWWYKLKTGTCVYGVFWNNQLENGLGDIDIKKIDILNVFWEPGKQDIQKSRNFFVVDLVDNDLLTERYPELKDKTFGEDVTISEYIYDDTVDTSKKSAVIDWYYKKNINGRQVLHYVKYVNNIILYASENDPNYYERGFYDHGEYPFVFDTLFVEEGMAAGFGYIDIMKDCHLYIDELNNNILKSSLLATRPRFFVSDGRNINLEEYRDISNDFVSVSGKIDDSAIKKIEYEQLGNIYLSVLQMKIDELKETSGNRDFSQGSTQSGVTAASAISALQEAGSKLSRDMLKSSYRAFTKLNYIVIELIRQFYDEARSFRIIGETGAAKFVQYDNSRIKDVEQGEEFGVDTGYRRPIFDIKVSAQRGSPFSRVSQNELAKELYSMNAFNPQMTDQALIMLDMMDFEGKSTVEEKISQNGTFYSQIQQLQAQMLKMAQIIDSQNGTQITSQMAQEMQGDSQSPEAKPDQSGITDVNALGKAVQASNNTTAATASQRAVNIANPNK